MRPAGNCGRGQRRRTAMHLLRVTSVVVLIGLAACSSSSSKPRSSVGPDPTTTSTTATANGPQRILVTFGTSFGMCARACINVVSYADDAVLLRTAAAQGSRFVSRNTGRLTPAGRRDLASALAALDVESLRPTYGCPDCADGGATDIAIRTAARTVKTEYSFRGPPVALERMDAIGMEVLGALDRCRSTARIAVDAGCVPAPAS